MCVCVNFYLSKLCFWGLINWLVFSALTLLVRRQEENPTCKYGGVGCWRGYLSGARCRLAYAPADAIATHCLLTDTRLTAFFPGLPRWAGTRNVNPIWILLKQETVSGSSISWAICKSAPRSRQITMPAIHHSVFYRPDAFPAAQPTASKHWRDKHWRDMILTVSCFSKIQTTEFHSVRYPAKPSIIFNYVQQRNRT